MNASKHVFDVGDRVRYTQDKIERAGWDHVTYAHADLDIIVREVGLGEPHRLWCQHADSPLGLPLGDCAVVFAGDVEPVRTDYVGVIDAEEDEREALAALGVRTGPWVDGAFTACELDNDAFLRLEPHWGWWTWTLFPAGVESGRR